MKKRNTADSSYARPDSQGKMFVLRLSGFWGTLIAIAVLLLLLPLVMAFFLFFIVGLIAVAVIGIGYAWWYGKNLRRMRTSYEEDTIELAPSEYHALKEPGEKAVGRSWRLDESVPRTHSQSAGMRCYTGDEGGPLGAGVQA